MLCKGSLKPVRANIVDRFLRKARCSVCRQKVKMDFERKFPRLESHTVRGGK